VYFAYVVTTASPPQGASATSPFFDDSVELYIGGSGALLGNYRPGDRQFIVDHNNLVGAYATGSPVAKTGFTSQVVASANGFVVEVQVAASVLGVAALAAGTKLALDLATGRGDGASQLGQLFWALQAPDPCACTASCCCGATGQTDQPSCDSRRWSVLELR
jgi:hypothetical protein